MDQDGTWRGGGPQPRQLCIRRGPSPPPKFSAHFYCGQTAERIKMPLGMEVDLSPGDFVFDGDPDPLPKMGAEPASPTEKIWPMFIVAKRLGG